MAKRIQYEHPLISRYSTSDMSYIWSPEEKFKTWRKLWISLAKSQRELGLNISQEQINEMQNNVNNINYEVAENFERIFHHDVMAHVHAYGELCPLAKPIIHLGATSCYVGDNTDLILIKQSLYKVKTDLITLIRIMQDFAVKHRYLPTLGFTHFQPAQLTTVGKRCVLWIQDLLMDISDIHNLIQELPMRGIKGTTGTQATFLELFDGNHSKVKELNRKICNEMGFSKWISVSGQTYSRKWDDKVISILSSLSQSTYKICNDIRLLSSMKEIEEPFDKNQIGSSAMAYKRNPMKCERVCSIARYVMGLPNSTANTHANQWFERTLDDSAIRRIVLPESFLAVDVIISTMIKIMDGIKVWPAVIDNNIRLELPFMATEIILMHCVKAGGDRQFLHELIRQHSIDAGIQVKQYGYKNDLIDRIKNDNNFSAIHHKLDDLMNPSLFIGRAPEQVDEFINEDLEPILQMCENI